MRGHRHEHRGENGCGGIGAARYVGTRQPRKEDGRLLTGRGQFTDDVRVPGMLHVAYVRSAVARGGSSRSTSTPRARCRASKRSTRRRTSPPCR
ncbi:hypothetical protein ACFSLT_00475 [Novosphingobium resinovorum]